MNCIRQESSNGEAMIVDSGVSHDKQHEQSNFMSLLGAGMFRTTAISEEKTGKVTKFHSKSTSGPRSPGISGGIIIGGNSTKIIEKSQTRAQEVYEADKAIKVHIVSQSRPTKEAVNKK